jgi:hypothetical protein
VAEGTAALRTVLAGPQGCVCLECQQEDDGRTTRHREERRVRNAVGAKRRVRTRDATVAQVRQRMELRGRLRQKERNQREQDDRFSPAENQDRRSSGSGAW